MITFSRKGAPVFLTPNTRWIVLTVALLSACAQTGPRSPYARPVLYPNATLKQLGEAKAQDDIAGCMASATAAGLSPEEKNNEVARGAAKGAAVGGTVGAVGALVNGRLEKSLEQGVKGAVVGGTVGAVASAFHERPNMTFRHFVQRCLADKGLEVIGWN
jgi:hypothetical protein